MAGDASSAQAVPLPGGYSARHWSYAAPAYLCHDAYYVVDGWSRDFVGRDEREVFILVRGLRDLRRDLDPNGKVQIEMALSRTRFRDVKINAAKTFVAQGVAMAVSR